MCVETVVDTSPPPPCATTRIPVTLMVQHVLYPSCMKVSFVSSNLTQGQTQWFSDLKKCYMDHTTGCFRRAQYDHRNYSMDPYCSFLWTYTTNTIIETIIFFPYCSFLWAYTTNTIIQAMIWTHIAAFYGHTQQIRSYRL